MINKRYITKVQKGGIPAGTVGIDRSVEGDEGIVLYFGLTFEPKYQEYQSNELTPYTD